MTEEPKDNIKSTVEVVTALINAVPLYNDAVHPAAVEVGKSLEIVAKTVNIALTPLKGLVWGFEKIEKWLNTRVTQKLVNVPDTSIKTPPLHIAGPTIEAMRYLGDQTEIRELFATLLAASMNQETSTKAHPSYVEVIKNITPDEALILKVFSNKAMHPYMDIYTQSNDDSSSKTLLHRHHTHLHKGQNLKNPDLISSYLDNLYRLGLLESPGTVWMSAASDSYALLEADSDLNKLKETMTLLGRTLTFEKRLIRTTSYGDQFIDNVIKQSS